MYPILPCDGRRSTQARLRGPAGVKVHIPIRPQGVFPTLRTAIIVLAAAFPVTAHLSVVWTSPSLAVACIAILGLVVLLPGLASRRWQAVTGAVLLSAALPWLLRSNLVWLPLYAPSVLGDLAACWLFGHTLGAGRTPLVTRLVQVLHAPEPLPEAVSVYTRRLTALWALLFLGLGAVSALLALFADPHGILALMGWQTGFTVPQRLWSLFANCLEYVLVAALMGGEYLWRRRRFPQQPYRGFIDFLRRAVAAAPAAGRASLRRGGPA